MGYALSQLIIVGLIEERERCIIVYFFFMNASLKEIKSV